MLNSSYARGVNKLFKFNILAIESEVMIYFYIDSATQRADLVLFDEGKVLGSKVVAVGPLTKEDLFVTVEQLFKECGLDLKDLHYVGIGVGPGSYTGIRVASSIGATLAYSLEIPLITLTSMDGYAHAQPFVTVFDAKRGKVYIQEGSKEPRLVGVEELKPFIDKGYILLTPHKESFKNQEGNWVEAAPDFGRIGSLLKNKFTHKQFADPKNVNLIYLQNPYL